MFSVRRKTAEALYEAQDPRLKNRLRLDVSPSFRAENLRGKLDVEIAMAAIGERTLQVMGGFADDKAIESPEASFVVLMPGPDRFEQLLERRLKQSFGLDQSAGATGPHTALQLLGDDFAAWVEKAPQEAQEYSVFAEVGSQFPICMRCEPFLSSYTSDRKSGSIQSVDPFKPARREPGSTG
jgi:hypothetical protein